MQDFQAKVVIERGQFGDEAARQPRAHPGVEAFEQKRRAVGSHHDLLAAVDQRIQSVAELLLERAPLQKLHVVDEEQVDGAQLLLERRGVAGLESLREAVHEPLGREVQHLGVGVALLHLPRDGVKEVRLAHAYPRVDVERVIFERLIRRVFGDL